MNTTRRRRLRRVRHHHTLPPINLPSPPRDVAAYAAFVQSCRGAWEAARFGDRDPQVLALARVYREWTGMDWRVRA